MLALISPAKTLDFDTRVETSNYSQPAFLEDSQQLIEELRGLSPADISDLMKISDKLGTLNFCRFQDWQLPFTEDNAKAALLAFKGDVYTGLQAETFDADDLEFAQSHLRILSGLYGLLRPLDLMQAYRLEMGTGFANQRGKNLYEFWGDKITQALNALLAQQANSPVLVNLASNEYFKAVKERQVEARVVTPVFKDYKGDKYKIISFYAKKARGLMVNYMIKNRLTDVEQLKNFDVEGYAYSESMSSANEWVFIRRP